MVAVADSILLFLSISFFTSKQFSFEFFPSNSSNKMYSVLNPRSMDVRKFSCLKMITVLHINPMAIVNWKTTNVFRKNDFDDFSFMLFCNTEIGRTIAWLHWYLGGPSTAGGRCHE